MLKYFERLNNIVNILINDILQEPNWTNIKYFHPNGDTMPNGYHRGQFLLECRKNRLNFEQHKGKIKGGIIIFSTDLNGVNIDKTKLNNDLKEIQEHLLKQDWEEYVDYYNVGNFFKGKFIGKGGEIYNENSLSIEIYGLSTKLLLIVAEIIAQEYNQETILVKDLKDNKIYLGDYIPPKNKVKNIY